jgi:TrmH family RNA methyltransferase
MVQPAPLASVHNPTVKFLRSLAQKKHRQEAGLFVAEGADMLARAKALGWVPEMILSVAAFEGWAGVKTTPVSDKVMAALSAQSNPPGVLATFAQRWTEDVTPGGTWIALENIRDPGNLGTIMRTADAGGAAGIILVEDCVDPFAPECVRASTGSVFAVPLARLSLAAMVDLMQAWPGEKVATSMAGDSDFRRAYRAPALLCMGSESAGLSRVLSEACGVKVRIPMKPGVESLNVATATALMLYEINRGALA